MHTRRHALILFPLLMAGCSPLGKASDRENDSGASTDITSGLPLGVDGAAAAPPAPEMQEIGPEDMEKIELVGVACTFIPTIGNLDEPLLGSDDTHAVIMVGGKLISLANVTAHRKAARRSSSNYQGSGYELKVSWDASLRKEEGIEGASWPAWISLRGPAGGDEIRSRGRLTCGA